MQPLEVISPIDGRYRDKTKSLATYFSEFALIKYRVRVEILYFIALCDLPLEELKSFDKKNYPELKKIYENFSIADAQVIKDTEKKINHDVKAVEYFLRKGFKRIGLERYIEFIHFAITSQDINNTAIPLMLKSAAKKVILPILEKLIHQINQLSKDWKDITMLSFTHGQPASPTKLGKELGVFSYRLSQQLNIFKNIPFSAKFGGANGNFNAHCVAYPKVDWIGFANYFVNEILKLQRAEQTTQIENYDHLAAQFDSYKRINTILIDLCRDIWQYISLGYFKQTITSEEVGSSTMPHKINPIDFENAEGNLGIANALNEFFSAKLPISRLQRDLTDSTVLRNIGIPLSHTLIALQSIMYGLSKLQPNLDKLNEDLEKNWAVVAEAIQTILRQKGFTNPYKVLKQFFRSHQEITPKIVYQFIENLDISLEVKEILKDITPFNYTGIS